MTQTLINTLRFADRLKEAGFVGQQAEALARILGDELTEQLPSKADFKTLEANVGALDASLTGRMDALESRLDGRIDAAESSVNGRIDALESNVNSQIKTLAGKINGQRFAFNLVLAALGVLIALVGVLVAIGLVEPVSQLLGS